MQLVRCLRPKSRTDYYTAENGDDGPADNKFVNLYGKQKSSLVQVRPDGFITARLGIHASDAPDVELHQVMARLL